MTYEQYQRFYELHKVEMKLFDLEEKYWNEYKNAEDRDAKDEAYHMYVKTRSCSTLLDKKMKPYFDMMGKSE